MKSSLPSPTLAEQVRIDQLKVLGCVACATLGQPAIGHELHHILCGNVRMGHWYTIWLCTGHHRGVWTPEQFQWMEPKKMVAISDGRKAFTRFYPSERELWETTQQRLKLPTDWPVSKIVARGS